MRRPTTRRCDSESMSRNLQRFRHLLYTFWVSSWVAWEMQHTHECSVHVPHWSICISMHEYVTPPPRYHCVFIYTLISFSLLSMYSIVFGIMGTMYFYNIFFLFLCSYYCFFFSFEVVVSVRQRSLVNVVSGERAALESPYFIGGFLSLATCSSGWSLS